MNFYQFNCSYFTINSNFWLLFYKNLLLEKCFKYLYSNRSVDLDRNRSSFQSRNSVIQSLPDSTTNNLSNYNQTRLLTPSSTPYYDRIEQDSNRR